ncbi:MAG: glycoside hydrolase family 16 protein, partial [Flavobacteriaceae bacterium]
GNSEVIENTEGSIEYQYSNNGTYTIGIWSFYDENLNSFNYQTLDVTITNALGDEIKQIDESLIDTTEETTLYTGYQLVWNDEFNYEGPPADEKWHHQYIPIFGGGWANNEKQHYTARIDNSYVSEGTLKITAKKENYTYEGSLKNFTSARLNSKFSLLYGRIDVRAKLPASKGTWPAIWTLGTNSGERGNYFGTVDGNVGWPECGEIDIMEQNGENKQILYGTFHWADGGGQPASYGLTKDVSSLDISDVTSEFHLYSLVWNTASIKLLVDNLLIAEIENTASVPFDNPHYLILNIAMGGTLGGTIPGNFEQDSMEIDFVRFYQ